MKDTHQDILGYYLAEDWENFDKNIKEATPKDILLFLKFSAIEVYTPQTKENTYKLPQKLFSRMLDSLTS